MRGGINCEDSEKEALFTGAGGADVGIDADTGLCRGRFGGTRRPCDHYRERDRRNRHDFTPPPALVPNRTMR